MEVELKQAEFQTALTDARLNYWKPRARLLFHAATKTTNRLLLLMIMVVMEEVMLPFWSDHAQQKQAVYHLFNHAGPEDVTKQHFSGA